MQLFEELSKAIKQKNNAAIDALMFISKIESIRNEKFNFQEFKAIISNHYKTPTKSHYEIYFGDDVNLFYNSKEIKLDDTSLVVERIEKHLERIEQNVEGELYKYVYFKVINKYLKYIGLTSVQAKGKKKKQVFKFVLTSCLIILFMAYTAISVHYATGLSNPSSYKDLLMFMFVHDSFSYVLLLLFTSGISIFFPKSFLIKVLTIFISVITLIITVPYIVLYTTPEAEFESSTIIVKEVSLFNDSKDIKLVLDSQSNVFLVHKNLELSKGKEYNIKNFPFFRIIYSAEEVAGNIDLKNAGKND